MWNPFKKHHSSEQERDQVGKFTGKDKDVTDTKTANKQFDALANTVEKAMELTNSMRSMALDDLKQRMDFKDIISELTPEGDESEIDEYLKVIENPTVKAFIDKLTANMGNGQRKQQQGSTQQNTQQQPNVPVDINPDMILKVPDVVLKQYLKGQDKEKLKKVLKKIEGCL